MKSEEIVCAHLIHNLRLVAVTEDVVVVVRRTVLRRLNEHASYFM